MKEEERPESKDNLNLEEIASFMPKGAISIDDFHSDLK